MRQRLVTRECQANDSGIEDLSPTSGIASALVGAIAVDD